MQHSDGRTFNKLKEKYDRRKKERESGTAEDSSTSSAGNKSSNDSTSEQEMKSDEKVGEKKEVKQEKRPAPTPAATESSSSKKAKITPASVTSSKSATPTSSRKENTTTSSKTASSKSTSSKTASSKTASSKTTSSQLKSSSSSQRSSSSRSSSRDVTRTKHQSRSRGSSRSSSIVTSSNVVAAAAVTTTTAVVASSNGGDELEELLSMKTTKEQVDIRHSDVIQELLSIPSHKELNISKHFRSTGGPQVQEFCQQGTREECLRKVTSYNACRKLHFRKILKPHTDENLGDCSFLNTCFHMETCKYVHYEIDSRGHTPTNHHHASSPRHHKQRSTTTTSSGGGAITRNLKHRTDIVSDDEYLSRKMLPPQWVKCDIRVMDFPTLGKFSVIMADPPWDIHMELPYGTMKDSEMSDLKIENLSDDGLIFLWVTGRAMELGRELFEKWGYKRCDELIWVKTNQLQRLIRTGRTGHWINHGKEHCLIGIKGNPKNINRRLDCDVLVAEVRDTSHKPDEIYGIIERLSPGTRKLELFGRMHNIQPNWVTLGNQLDGVHIVETDMVTRFTSQYPSGEVKKPTPSPNPQAPTTTEQQKHLDSWQPHNIRPLRN